MDNFFLLNGSGFIYANFNDIITNYFDNYLKETCCIEYVCKQKKIYLNIFNQLEKMSKKENWDEFHPEIFQDNTNNYPEPNNENSYPDHPLITNKLTANEKLELYNAAIKNNIELFKILINGSNTKKPYPIFEEVSEKNNYWTVFHYAMQYACWDIIKFIFEYLYSSNQVDEALNMKTNDLRCPLLCLLKSNAISHEIKRETFRKIITTFPIHVNSNVLDELTNRIKLNTRSTGTSVSLS